MFSWRGVTWARALTCCVVLLAFAASETVSDPHRDVSVRDSVLAYMREAGVVGCSVAIAEKGKIVFSSGFGFADLENPAEAKPETLFRLASISKPLTAVAVMKLVESGAIDLDADIRKYVPEFPEKDGVMTVAHVLSHTSGIRHYKNDEFASTKRYASVRESLKIFDADPLLHKPGEAYTYSTYGYTLLARLVETVSGKPFPEFLKSAVFAPTGMAATRIDDAAAIIPDRAKGYRQGPNGKPINSEFADTSYKWGGGGILSTAPDMARFGIALLDSSLLNKRTLDRMWTSARLPNGNPTRYGLGFHVNELAGKRMVSHTGSQQGAQTAILIFPDHDVVIVALTNYENHRAMDLARKLAETWLGIDAKTPLGGRIRSTRNSSPPRATPHIATFPQPRATLSADSPSRIRCKSEHWRSWPGRAMPPAL